jgi:hypothetical protein
MTRQNDMWFITVVTSACFGDAAGVNVDVDADADVDVDSWSRLGHFNVQ